MLTDKDLGIKKFILDRIMQINDEIIESDPVGFVMNATAGNSGIFLDDFIDETGNG